MRHRIGWRVRYSVVALVASTLAAIGVGLSPALAQQGSGSKGAAVVCQLSGRATVRPGVTKSPSPFKATIVGTLSGCTSDSDSPASGTLKASAIGTGSCATHTEEATGSIAWANGRRSRISFAVTGVVNVDIELFTVTSGLFAHESGPASVVTQPDSGQDCFNVAVTGTSFTGVVSLVPVEQSAP